MITQCIERRETRMRVAITGQCRSALGQWDCAQLNDLSPHGCCLTSSGRPLRDSIKVIIRIAGLEGLPGTVRWISDLNAGIEFDRPLYLPVFEDICRKFGKRA